MPASLEHLLAGRRAAELLRPEELPQYYLGCIAPDAPNLDGFASKEVHRSGRCAGAPISAGRSRRNGSAMR